MKYIDAERLTTIIEERKAQQDQWINSYHEPINQGISQELTEILSIISSLQQERPEIDWEKELRNWMVEMDGKYALLTTDYVDRLIIDTAKHFYELGLNARKEE